MKRDMAKLRRENRQIEDRLVQQEHDNGDLTAQLDDARNLLREKGLDPGERATAHADGASEFGEGPRTRPAAQSNRKRRKPPVARIPGSFSPATPDRGASGDPDDESGMLGPPQDPSGPADAPESVGLRFGDDLDHHSGYSGSLRWSPIAGPAVDPSSRVR